MDGVAEAKSNGGKTGTTAVGEPVDTEGREPEGKPVIVRWLSLTASEGRPLMMMRGLSLAGSEGKPLLRRGLSLAVFQGRPGPMIHFRPSRRRME